MMQAASWKRPVRLQPDSADAVYFLALTRKKENDPDRSTDLLRKLVALQPDNMFLSTSPEGSQEAQCHHVKNVGQEERKFC